MNGATVCLILGGIVLVVFILPPVFNRLTLGVTK